MKSVHSASLGLVQVSVPAVVTRWATGRRSRGPRRIGHGIAVGALALLAAAAYMTYSIVDHAHFGTTIYDAVIFDQAVRGYAGLGPPVSTALGDHYGYGPAFSVLGDHFSPILAVLAPLYWIHDGPITLYVAQAVLFAAAVPPLWVFTRRALGAAAAYLVALGYAVSWEIQGAVAFDFHEVAFVPFLMAMAFERAQAGRRGQAAAFACALLLVKEDMGLAVSGFGVYLLAQRSWRLGTALTIGGVTATWLTTRFVIPFFGGTANARWHYDALGEDVPAALLHVLTDPLHTLQVATTPDVKVHTLLWVFAPLLFCSLLSPMVLPAVPLLAERLLAADMPTWWDIGYQYDAFIVIPVICAAVDGARRLHTWAAKLGVPGVGFAWAGAVCLISLALVPRFPLGNLWQPGWYATGPLVAAQRAAVATVPDGVRVAADNHLGPHLTTRTRVLLFDTEPSGAPWVVVDIARWHFPFTSLEQQRQSAADLVQNGYEIVFRRNGIVVLHLGED